MKFIVILTVATVAKKVGVAVGESGCVCSSTLKFCVIFDIKLLWLGAYVIFLLIIQWIS